MSVARRVDLVGSRSFRGVWAGSWGFCWLCAGVGGMCATLAASEPVSPTFRIRAIDRTATYSAAAAFDVDRDGRLDIVTGGFWYRAPAWTRQPVREVEFIRGRYDDYACLPVDVNRDGWTDFLISNYRSQKVAWIEHPGAAGGPWQEHVVQRPGPSETGRLADVDGDGQLDLLPNGTKQAAWWEIRLTQNAAGRPEPQIVPHSLPPELAGHGIGCGDIDGDGRPDLVGARGWARGPEAPRTARWEWHPEFFLDKDASVPIQVHDVDGDGDADLIWARGHGTGLYWHEQVPPDAARGTARRWVPHAIDTSWSQPHTVELADIDGDGRRDIVTGKRYLGHDGQDLGEWDPLVIYWYRFDPARRTWRRYPISEGAGASFDVDPKLVDLDGDGDIDVVAPGRSGLYLVENLLRDQPGTPPSPPRATQVPTYPDHVRLLVVRDPSGGERTIRSPADWAARRSHILAHLQRVLGPLPPPERRVPLDVHVISEETTNGVLRRKLTFAAEPGDRVPAWLLVPQGPSGPRPGALCLHQTIAQGKDEPVGLAGDRSQHLAVELAARGYVCLVPDYPSLGEYAYDFAAHPEYASGSMKAVWNNLRALDLLESLPEVDADRLAVVGHSLGGHNALFTAVFDLRIRAVVTSCGYTAFGHDDLPSWTGPRYMPRLAADFGNDPARVPFDFHELLAACAPRPVLTSAALEDDDFAVAGVREVQAAAGTVYDLLGARQNLAAIYPPGPHGFPEAARAQAWQWLDRVLKHRQ